jgi:hypothetical protein
VNSSTPSPRPPRTSESILQADEWDANHTSFDSCVGRYIRYDTQRVGRPQVIFSGVFVTLYGNVVISFNDTSEGYYYMCDKCYEIINERLSHREDQYG